MKQVICLLLATLVCCQLQSTTAAPSKDETLLTVGDDVEFGGDENASLYPKSTDNPIFNAGGSSGTGKRLSVIRPFRGTNLNVDSGKNLADVASQAEQLPTEVNPNAKTDYRR